MVRSLRVRFALTVPGAAGGFAEKQRGQQLLHAAATSLEFQQRRTGGIHDFESDAGTSASATEYKPKANRETNQRVFMVGVASSRSWLVSDIVQSVWTTVPLLAV